MEQPRQSVVRGNEAAVWIMRDRNGDRGARYQIGKRSKAHAKFISRGVGRRFEERRKTGHEGQGIVEYMSEGE